MPISIGSKVVCIDDDFSKHPDIHKDYQQLPVKHETYVVREMRPMALDGGLMLDELHNKPIWFDLVMGFLEPGFAHRRFVPLEDFVNEIEVENVLSLPQEMVNAAA